MKAGKGLEPVETLWEGCERGSRRGAGKGNKAAERAGAGWKEGAWKGRGVCGGGRYGGKGKCKELKWKAGRRLETAEAVGGRQ